ncbi:hypothetical protein J3456_02785 [Sulfitobacter sp. NFXS29]
MANFADRFTDEQRVERAKQVTDKLVDHVLGLIALAENNAVVLYSDTISSQVPRSNAAHAFNEMQRSMHFYFLVRLSAVWDKPSKDRESIPTVLALLDKEGVRGHFAEETYAYHSITLEPSRLNPTADSDEQRMLAEYWRRQRTERAERESRKVRRWLLFVKQCAPKVEETYVTSSLRPFRDSYLAHNLEASIFNESNPVQFRYGDEAKLLKLTIRIVDRLHRSVNGAGFDWDGAQDHARRNANEFWSSCRFDIPSL